MPGKNLTDEEKLRLESEEEALERAETQRQNEIAPSMRKVKINKKHGKDVKIETVAKEYPDDVPADVKRGIEELKSFAMLSRQRALRTELANMKAKEKQNAKQMTPRIGNQQILTKVELDCKTVFRSYKIVKEQLKMYELHLKDKHDPVAKEKKAAIANMKLELNAMLAIANPKRPPKTAEGINAFYNKLDEIKPKLAANLDTLSKHRTKKEESYFAKLKLAVMDFIGIKPKGILVASGIEEQTKELESISRPRL